MKKFRKTVMTAVATGALIVAPIVGGAGTAQAAQYYESSHTSKAACQAVLASYIASAAVKGKTFDVFYDCDNTTNDHRGKLYWASGWVD